MTALQGGLDKEYGIIIRDNDLLLSLILSIFKRRDLPLDVTNNEISQSDKNKYKKLLDWITREIETKEGPRKTVALLQLDACMSKPLFRYFLETFAFSQLPCLAISTCEDQIDDYSNLTIDIYYHKDFSDERASVRGLERFFLVGKGRKLVFPLDAVGSAELYEAIVQAPKGTVFASRRTLSRKKNLVCGYPHVYDNECIAQTENAQMNAWGFLAPEYTYIEACQKWPENDLTKPWRRIPIDDQSKKHAYKLEVLICPKLNQIPAFYRAHGDRLSCVFLYRG